MSASSTSLRILHVAPMYFPATRYGGPIISVHGLCKALVALGHQVDVITTNVDGPGDSNVPLNEPVRLDGVNVRYFESRYFRRLYWSGSMFAALPDAVRRSDIVHLHSVFLWPTNAAARVARGLGVPYVLSPRGALVPELIERRNRLVKTAWLKLVERNTLKHADRLQVTSHAEGRNATRIGLSIPPSVVIPNGVDLPDTVDATTANPDVAREMSAGPYAVFLGRISWEKGLWRLLRAVGSTPIRVLLAGFDDRGHRAKLEAQARNAGLSSQFVFLGTVEGRDKWTLLRGARFLVAPSYSESFGNAVIEAMAVGCPVIVTPEVGVAEWIRSGVDGIVTHGDPDSLRHAMLELWSDAAKRDAISRAASTSARAQFAWSSIAKMTEASYREVLQARASARR